MSKKFESSLSHERLVASNQYPRVSQFTLEDTFLSDPLMACIKLSRFKFVSKMLTPHDRVLDIGCGSGLGSYFYSGIANSVLGLDVHPDYETIEKVAPP